MDNQMTSVREALFEAFTRAINLSENTKLNTVYAQSLISIGTIAASLAEMGEPLHPIKDQLFKAFSRADKLSRIAEVQDISAKALIAMGTIGKALGTLSREDNRSNLSP